MLWSSNVKACMHSSWVESHSCSLKLTLVKRDHVKNHDTCCMNMTSVVLFGGFSSWYLLVYVRRCPRFALTQVDFILTGRKLSSVLVEYSQLSAPNSICRILPSGQLTPMATHVRWCTYSPWVSHNFILGMTPLAFFSWSLKTWEKSVFLFVLFVCFKCEMSFGKRPALKLAGLVFTEI